LQISTYTVAVRWLYFGANQQQRVNHNHPWNVVEDRWECHTHFPWC